MLLFLSCTDPMLLSLSAFSSSASPRSLHRSTAVVLRDKQASRFSWRRYCFPNTSLNLTSATSYAGFNPSRSFSSTLTFLTLSRWFAERRRDLKWRA